MRKMRGGVGCEGVEAVLVFGVGQRDEGAGRDGVRDGGVGARLGEGLHGALHVHARLDPGEGEGRGVGALEVQAGEVGDVAALARAGRLAGVQRLARALADGVDEVRAEGRGRRGELGGVVAIGHDLAGADERLVDAAGLELGGGDLFFAEEAARVDGDPAAAGGVARVGQDLFPGDARVGADAAEAAGAPTGCEADRGVGEDAQRAHHERGRTKGVRPWGARHGGLVLGREAITGLGV